MERSDEDFERIGREWREALGVDDQLRLDMLDVLKKLKQKGLIADYVRVTDLELPGVEARFCPDTRTIKITDKTWAKAEHGDPRANWTIAHELGHVVFRPNRARNRSSSPRAFERSIPSIVKDERPAHRFAAAFLAPLHMANISPTTTAADLAARFNLSAELARIRLEELGRLHRRRFGLDRSLPPSVVAYLIDAERTGHRISSLTAADRAAAARSTSTNVIEVQPICPLCGEPGLLDVTSTKAFCRNCGPVEFPDGDKT